MISTRELKTEAGRSLFNSCYCRASRL